jgi:glucose-fructose oxidoreductase
MVAYRLHFEAANLKAVEILESGRIGEPRIFSSTFTMDVRDRDNIRLDADRGGGTLHDIGIYCINAARYLFRDEPEEVFAWTAARDDRRFEEVEEMAACTLRFPGQRLATFVASFGAADVSSYRVVGTEGDLVVEPAYEYAGELGHRLTVGGRTREKTFAKRDQIAPELMHFSECVLEGRDPEPSGEEGLADVRIIEALYESARAGAPVRLGEMPRVGRRPTIEQERRAPPVEKPEVVRATPPSGGG